ncbi:MAG TPA: TonB-dependent receptor, partial [Tepidisphaeraceae bacterium]|nr:TonB-dependent receptor [Tepidisphaeraceae bacterium]
LLQAHGANVLGRWSHRISDESDFAVQMYYDHLDREPLGSPYHINTGDIDGQYRFPMGARQSIICGADFRYWADNLAPGPIATFVPQVRDSYLVNGFIQDDLTVVPDRLHLIAGTKLEDNSQSGFEYQPSGRLLWTPNESNSAWLAVSRAVRTPARWEQDARISPIPSSSPLVPLPVAPQARGNPGFDSETLLAYEAGYRVKPSSTFSVDAAAFLNSYDNLRGFDTGAPSFIPTPVPHLLVPITVANSFYAESYGAELSANWQVNEHWRLAGSYSFLQVQAHQHKAASAANDDQERMLESSSPEHQAQLHSYWDITRDLQLNMSLYYVDRLSALNVPSYIRGDVGVTWTPRKNLVLSLVVQNVFDNHHPEFQSSGTTLVTSSEVPRTMYGQVVFRY